MIDHVAHLRWLLVLMTSWMRACLLSESISIVLRVILISAADFLSSRTKSKNMYNNSTAHLKYFFIVQCIQKRSKFHD